MCVLALNGMSKTTVILKSAGKVTLIQYVRFPFALSRPTEELMAKTDVPGNR